MFQAFMILICLNIIAYFYCPTHIFLTLLLLSLHYPILWWLIREFERDSEGRIEEEIKLLDKIKDKSKPDVK